jgi:hypothetical protein
MKAVSLVSAVVFIAITISAMALIYQAGIPIIQRMQSSAALDRMTSTFLELDDTIERVASEGNGSRRIFDLDTGSGRLDLDTEGDEISWHLDAEDSVLRPRTARFLGNVVSGSNLGSSLYEGVHGSYDTFILENEHIRAYIRKIQPEQDYSTGTLLLDVYQKDLGEWLPFDYLNISLDNQPSSESGLGRTEAERTGTNLPRARVTAYMDSGYANYFITFSLESGADFLTIEAELV